MDAETLAGTAGALLSLLFAYIPGLSGWYARLGEEQAEENGGVYRRLVMLGALLVTALGSYGLACSRFGATFGLALTCDQNGLAGLLRALVLALAANQATYSLAVRRTAMLHVANLVESDSTSSGKAERQSHGTQAE